MRTSVPAGTRMSLTMRSKASSCATCTRTVAFSAGRAKRTSGRSKRPGIAVRSGAGSSLTGSGFFALASMAAPKPAGMSVPVLRCADSSLTLPSSTSLRVAPLSPSSATRYCVPRTPTTAVGVVTSSGWLRLSLAASTSTEPRSMRMLPANQPSAASFAACASVAPGPRLATISARLDGGTRTREPSASASTAEPFAPVSICWPSASAMPACAAAPATRTSPTLLASATGSAWLRISRAGTRSTWPGRIRFASGRRFSRAISRQACGPVNTVSERPISVSRSLMR